MSRKITAYGFCGFVLNVDLRTLAFQERPVPITPKAFQILVILLRHHGSVVEKEFFLKEVWPDTFVEESTLAQNIHTLRKAFAKFDQVKELIVTVPRRGYQFVETVEEISSGENFPVLGNRGDKREIHFAKMSPDGNRLACAYWDPKTDKMLIALVSGETDKVLAYPITPPNDDIQFLDWSSDGDNLYAVLRRDESVSLWRILVNGDPPVQLGEWEAELNLRLAISKGRQQLSYEVATN